MSNFAAYAENPFPFLERRRHVRQAVGTLAYVELDEGNGGIVLNVSEGGVSVQAVASLTDNVLPRVRFQLSQSPEWIETSARVTWAGESRKLAGLEFIDLSERARAQIRQWLTGETPAIEELAGEKADFESEVAKSSELFAVGAPAPAPAPAPAAAPASVEPLFIPLSAEPSRAAVAAPLAFAASSIAPSGIVPSAVVKDEGKSAQPVIDAAATMPEPLAAESAVPFSDHPLGHAPGPSETRDFKFSTVGESASVVAGAPERQNAWTLVAFIAFLALVSLAAGWAAGHGTVNKVLEKIRSIAALRQGGTHAAPPALANRIARVSEIEVVNLNNQRWTIPFDSPSSQGGARSETPGNSGQEVSKPAVTFNTWVLSPPVRAPGDAEGSAAQTDAPAPALPETPANSDNGPGSPLVANNIALQSVLPRPQVRQSGILKLGELIHRVEPIYPVVAREQRMEGTVRLRVSVAEDGSVRNVIVLGGPPTLVPAAEGAVGQWRYAPTTLDGRPVESERDVSLIFHL